MDAKMKIEPAITSFLTSFKMATQKMILSQKKAANLSQFSKSSKSTTSGQNAENSWENLGNFFFQYKSNSSGPVDEFLYRFGCLWDF